ncbi:MAG: hypothetical protein KJO25_08510 [Bacteroidia bacterium]|nr:hypothetical protein [Bacteroidia bacterium]
MTEDYSLFYSFNAALNIISVLVLLIAGILLLMKKRSAGSYLVFTGSILYTLTSIGSFVANLIAGRIGEVALVKTHAFASAAVTVAFLIFSIGVLKLVTEIRTQKHSN